MYQINDTATTYIIIILGLGMIVVVWYLFSLFIKTIHLLKIIIMEIQENAELGVGHVELHHSKTGEFWNRNVVGNNIISHTENIKDRRDVINNAASHLRLFKDKVLVKEFDKDGKQIDEFIVHSDGGVFRKIQKVSDSDWENNEVERGDP